MAGESKLGAIQLLEDTPLRKQRKTTRRLVDSPTTLKNPGEWTPNPIPKSSNSKKKKGKTDDSPRFSPWFLYTVTTLASL